MRNLLLIIIVLSLLGCERLEYGEKETYTVKEGEHKSDFPKTMTTGKELFVKVYFHASCRAKTVGPSGWNKLVGLMPGPLSVHQNSARWAWRYDPENDMIKLASYIWQGGIKPTEENGGIEYIYSVPLERGDFHEGTDWVELYVGNQYGSWQLLTGDSSTLGKRMYAPVLGNNFYILGLWYGGDGVPEHDVHVSYAFGEKKGFNINTD